MGLRINTNIAALNAHRNLEITDTRMAKNMERLSSGLRINRAADDAAGLAIAQKLSAQVRSLTVASRNASQASSLLQVAEGGADQIHSMLLRLKELATQAASYNNQANLSDIDAEAQKLKDEISRIAKSTKYLNTSLLTGFGAKTGSTTAVDNVYGLDVQGAATGTYSVTVVVAGLAGQANVTIKNSQSVTQTITVADGAQTVNFSTFGISFKTTEAFAATADGALLGDITVTGSDASFQVGDKNQTIYQISFQLTSIDTDAIGFGSGSAVSNISLSSLAGAQAALDIIDDAIADVNNFRASVGAIANRLEYTYANLQVSIENLSASESVIRDADMAMEMVSFTKTQILLQSGTAMLAQANMAPQNILSLLGR
ncbi:MAG: flagellin [bacterium]